MRKKATVAYFKICLQGISGHLTGIRTRDVTEYETEVMNSVFKAVHRIYAFTPNESCRTTYGHVSFCEIYLQAKYYVIQGQSFTPATNVICESTQWNTFVNLF
jgi:hypothetical protein